MDPHSRAGDGILQVHPTRLCNLACQHCYSASSPRLPGALGADLVSRAIEDAAGLGYSTVSLSGGEPLLYAGMDEILQAARRAGSRVNLVSNGILIASPRYRRRAGAFGIVALSLDGLEERHNRIRGSAQSFSQVRRAAGILRDDGQAFGLIHCLTAESVEEIEEIAALAAEWGAALLQLHPFETAGRGAAAVGMTPPAAQDRLLVYLLARLLQAQYPQMRIQVDLVHRDVARHVPEAFDAGRGSGERPPRELVLRDDGLLLPLDYGLPAHWAVADLRRQRLSEAWGPFMETRWPRLQRRLREVALGIARGRHGEISVWHGLMREACRVDEGEALLA